MKHLVATLASALALYAAGCTCHQLRGANPNVGVKLPEDHAAHKDAQTERSNSGRLQSPSPDANYPQSEQPSYDDAVQWPNQAYQAGRAAPEPRPSCPAGLSCPDHRQRANQGTG